MKTKMLIDNKELLKMHSTSSFIGNNQVAKTAELTNCVVKNSIIEAGVKIENALIDGLHIKSNKETERINLNIETKKEIKYQNFLLNFDSNFFDGTKLVLSCKKIEQGMLLKSVFEKLHVKVEYICLNTNVKFENMAEVVASYVKKYSADIGFAIDENKIWAVNFCGEILKGDDLLYIFAWWLKQQNKLKNSQIYGTILSNFGIEKKINALGLFLQRQVVSEKTLKNKMKKNKIKLGAFQNGKIFFEYNSKIENDCLLFARMLLTIYYENKNIWQRVKENNYLQIYKTIKLGKSDKSLKKNIEIISKFYKLKIQGKGRIEIWIKNNEINILIESKQKILNIIFFKEIIKKINKLIKTNKI